MVIDEHMMNVRPLFRRIVLFLVSGGGNGGGVIWTTAAATLVPSCVSERWSVDVAVWLGAGWTATG